MSVSYRTKSKAPGTLLQAVEASLLVATRHQPGVETQPTAVLWTDADGQWQPVVKKLQERLPQLVVFGEYDVTKRSGPAVWLKCIVGGTINLGLGKEVVPIVYLPNVSRQTLRAAADCPLLLQPLVELQYRGVVWTQRNGKDWTVEAFLVSDDGLGLDVLRDEATRNSLHSSLPVLAETPVAKLEGKRLEAEDFDKLMVGDHPRDLLEWMNSPKEARESWGDGKWHAFRSRCKKDYGFDPDEDGAVGAAEKLGLRKETAWQQLWDRFSEAPVLYKALPDLLTRAKPRELLFNPESWPDENDKAEARLRAALLDLGPMDGSAARARVKELENEHGKRRDWVWAKMERSPMADALEHLVALAEKTAKTLNGASLEAVAKNYEEGGYEADLKLLRALAEGKSNQDRAAIQAAARAVYLPWLRSAAELFQQLAAQAPFGGISQQPVIEANVGECLLFADGLRYDLGQALRALCEERGLRVGLGRRWAGTPTVTATAKPAVSPVTAMLQGGFTLPDNFAPWLKEGGQELTTARFRRLLEDIGYQYLATSETGDVTGKGWTECAAIDRRGHDMQLGLAGQVAEELDGIVERITELLDAGWRSVRVVTDHGWLLVPGGLPKTDLPGYLVESRWARCAAIKGQSKVSVPKVGWFWNTSAEAAIAPDITAFVAGMSYAHGGLSVQECLIPILTVQPVKDTAPTAVRIKTVEWQRLRCRVTLETAMAGVTVDIRTKANAPDTTLTTAPKTTDASGQVSLVVPDDDQAGAAAVVVLLDAFGNVLSKQATTIGES
ncbi:MAG: BREX-1 system phosphatase PglZ type B [Verrucomicrobiota bacterium]